MKKMKDCDGYRITKADEGWGYYIQIGSLKANVIISYEYDGACGTFEEVEKFLKDHSFEEVRKAFHDQYVYCECIEPIW